jgi:hypothetical protein
MPPRRTIRKPTRWTPQEWQLIEQEARRRAIPPLRLVREATLSAIAAALPAPPPLPRSGADELVHQLSRVLNNLSQLRRVAEDDGAGEAAARIGAVIHVTAAAVRDTPDQAHVAAAVLSRLVTAGRALNELARRANAAEELPPDGELREVLAAVETAVRSRLA